MDSKYNRLLAASCGCFVISFEEDEDIPYYLHLNSLDSIMDSISEIITNYEDIKHRQPIISEHICLKYNYDNFNTQLQYIIKENLL